MWRSAAELKCPMPFPELPFCYFPNKKGCYYGVNIRTNSLGFRDYEYSIEKPKNKKRIIFLGDSHTFGWGVAFDDIFPKRLERLLNREKNNYEVINMGLGNSNSVMQLKLFKWKGLQFKPDMVIVMYFINDTEPTPRRHLLPEHLVVRHSYFWAFLFDRFSKFSAHFIKTFRREIYYNNIYSQKNSRWLTSNERALTELINLCKKNNIKILIVNIPELYNFKNYPFKYATEYIKDLAKRQNIPFLDLLPSFSSHSPESLWVSLEDPHLNAKGHAIAAKAIYKKLLYEDIADKSS